MDSLTKTTLDVSNTETWIWQSEHKTHTDRRMHKMSTSSIMFYICELILMCDKYNKSWIILQSDII